MLFSSDNASGVCPEIMDAIIAVNQHTAPSYGNDEITKNLNDTFNKHFDTDVSAFPVLTGTAANALAVANLCPPWGAIFCHESSHLAVDECGAPEFYTGGAKLITLSGDDGKITPDGLESAISGFHIGNRHEVQPAVVSITQITEYGVTYSLDEIKAIAEITHRYDLYLHMDGARIANAVVALGCTPAELTWQAGVDVLSFGASKNGAMSAEAVVFFQKHLDDGFIYRHKRGGQLFAKMRFISVQLEAYMQNDVWRRNAEHSNRMARRLADGLTASSENVLFHPTDANLVFIHLTESSMENLRKNGYPNYKQPFIRLATSFNTTNEEVDDFIAAAGNS